LFAEFLIFRAHGLPVVRIDATGRCVPAAHVPGPGIGTACDADVFGLPAACLRDRSRQHGGAEVGGSLQAHPAG